MMMGSREAIVSYQTPLGVAHQFRSSDHYGPMPDEWFQRDDWSPVYYNKADSAGPRLRPLADRLATSSRQYFPPLAAALREHRHDAGEPARRGSTTCRGTTGCRSGRTFWDELVYRYQMGVQYVTWMRETWDTLQPFVGARRFAEVKAKLAHARGRRGDAGATRASTTGASSAAATIPVDGGPLSAQDHRRRQGSTAASTCRRAAYTIPVAAGASPAITQRAAGRPGARAARSSRRRRACPGRPS